MRGHVVRRDAAVCGGGQARHGHLGQLRAAACCHHQQQTEHAARYCALIDNIIIISWDNLHMAI